MKEYLLTFGLRREKAKPQEENYTVTKQQCCETLPVFLHYILQKRPFFFTAEFPKSLKTLDELTEYLTVIVFTASAQHAAVNFGQVTTA